MGNPLVDRETALRSGASAAVLQLVERRSLPMPKAASDAAEVLARLSNLAAQAGPSGPELPTDPAKVEHVLREAADRRVGAAAMRTVAAELRDEAVSRLNSEVANAGAGWVTALCKEFDKALATFRSAAPSAPRVPADQVSTLSSEHFRTWSHATNAIIELERLTEDRGILARLLNEPRPSHWGSILPLIAAVAPPTGDGRAVHDGFRERIAIKETLALRDATERWYGLLALEGRGWLRFQLCSAHGGHIRISLINAWPKAFEALSSRDHGQAFKTALADSGRTWQAVGARSR